MQLSSAPLLEHLRIFHSRNAEETGAFLRAKDYRFDVARRQAGELDARLNGVYMPGVYLGYVQYGGAAVSLSPGSGRTDYWLHLPLRGHLHAIIDRDSVACDPCCGAIVSPERDKCHLVSEADSSRIQLAISKSSLLERLGMLLGEQPVAPVDFAPALDLTSGYGRSLAGYVLMAVADLEQAGSVLWSPATMAVFEEFIATALLLSHRHNYCDALRRLDRQIAPRDVRRAIDYIEANLDAPLSIAAAARAAGVAGRTLLMHFRTFKGVSPMRYARNARFERVREALLQAQPGASVTGIAMSLGFTHMGRFSVEYRRRFGETPSQTLGERRRHRRQIRDQP